MLTRVRALLLESVARRFGTATAPADDTATLQGAPRWDLRKLVTPH